MSNIFSLNGESSALATLKSKSKGNKVFTSNLFKLAVVLTAISRLGVGVFLTTSIEEKVES